MADADDADDQPHPRPAPEKPNSEAQQEIDSREDEAAAVLAAGPGSGNRAGAFAFLAILVVIAAAVYYHMAGRGGDSFQNRLDSQLRNHAELAMASMDSETPVTVVPSWPHTLYHNLRGDIVVYAALAALAAYLWSRAAAARARRDAFLLNDQLQRQLHAELDALRRRIARIDGGDASGATSAHDDTGDNTGASGAPDSKGQ